jgi:beta-galactosidase
MNGLKAVNFYMLVERDRWQGCPITVDGRIREEYFDFYRNLTRFVREYGLNDRTRKPETLLLKNYELGRFQSLHSRADFSPLVSNAFVRGLDIPTGFFAPDPVLGLEFEHRARQHWCEEPWLDQLADRLTALGMDYNFSDSQLPFEEMMKYKTIYASSFECMSQELQQKLLDYLKSGRRVVVPRLPDKDLEQKSCTLLADALAKDKSLRLIVDDGIFPVLERRLLIPQGNSPLEYMLHDTAKGQLLFAANPTEGPCTGSVRILSGAKRGSPVWQEEGAAASFNEGLMTVTLPPYTVSVWEVEA